MIGRKCGWRRGLIDTRDFAAPIPRVSQVPAIIDHEPQVCPVMDQGPAGTCTGHGVMVPISYDIITRSPVPYEPLSRLWAYWWPRVAEGTQGSDSGAVIRDVIKSLAVNGVCLEEDWPYDLTKLYTAPDADAAADAPSYKALVYNTVANNPAAIELALADIGPIVFGTSVYESFDAVGPDGVVPMPLRGEPLMGGHCMAILGFNKQDRPGFKKVRNSYGVGWGADGNCYISDEYLSQYASDLWTIQMFGSDAEKAAGVA